VCITVSAVRYIVTPSHEKNAGAARSKVLSASASVSVRRAKSIGTYSRDPGIAMAAFSSNVRFQAWVAG